MRASKSPTGMPTITAAMKPVKNSKSELSVAATSSPDCVITKRLLSVAESGTRKAGLVLRPTISQSASPPKRLSQTRPCRERAARMVLLFRSTHHRVGVAPDRGVDEALIGGRRGRILDPARLHLLRDEGFEAYLIHAVVSRRPEPVLE